jgi:hypothetical protein
MDELTENAQNSASSDGCGWWQCWANARLLKSAIG